MSTSQIKGALVACLIAVLMGTGTSSAQQIRSIYQAHDALNTAANKGQLRNVIGGISVDYYGSGCRSEIATRIPFISKNIAHIRWDRIDRMYKQDKPPIGKGPAMVIWGQILIEDNDGTRSASNLTIFFDDLTTRDRSADAMDYLWWECKR